MHTCILILEACRKILKNLLYSWACAISITLLDIISVTFCMSLNSHGEARVYHLTLPRSDKLLFCYIIFQRKLLLVATALLTYFLCKNADVLYECNLGLLCFYESLFFRSGRIDLLLAQKYELLQSNSRLLGCERVMESRAEFHFSWVYTLSATLSSLRNSANNDRYRLRPSTRAQLCWSSSRLQALKNYNLIKFELIRPSTLSHDRNFWNFRGAPDETTCFAGFFRCPSSLILFLHEIV